MCIRDRYQRRVRGEQALIMETEAKDAIEPSPGACADDRDHPEQEEGDLRGSEANVCELCHGESTEAEPCHEPSCDDAICEEHNPSQETSTKETVTNAAVAQDEPPPDAKIEGLSLIHISEPTRLLSISYAVFCLKKKKK
eukprot:TRINITY_DN37533_c0_g1_i1.p1 TRINITY_DN37533_c0_g1~~TRINITY_DN37533_c0_g1_i1.p1  ORF type:complete len:140 (-),score=43.75 TRINITY_DN37533_c0_g1_i1:127-546(-)